MNVVYVLLGHLLVKQIAVGPLKFPEIVHNLLHARRPHIGSLRFVKNLDKILAVLNSSFNCGFKVFAEHLCHLGIISLVGPLLLFLVQALEIDGRTAHRAVLISPLMVPLLDARKAEAVSTYQFAIRIGRVADFALGGHCRCWVDLLVSPEVDPDTQPTFT